MTVDALGQGTEAEDTQTETAPRSAARSTEALAAPMGHLVSTDGVRIPLDRDYVLGREPEVDPTVRSGAATPVRLADDENLISRSQLHRGRLRGGVAPRRLFGQWHLHGRPGR